MIDAVSWYVVDSIISVFLQLVIAVALISIAFSLRKKGK